MRMILPTLGLALMAFALGQGLDRSHLLAAAPMGGDDVDGDGFPDALELILGTDGLSADTDSDGIGDMEEVARQSDPLVYDSVPGTDPVSAGALARASDGALHASFPIYVQGGNFAGVGLEFGAYVSGVQLVIPPQVYMPISTVGIFAASTPGDVILMFTMSIPQSLVASLGSISLYVRTAPIGAPAPTVAAVINLQSFGGVLVAVQATGGGVGVQGAGSQQETVYRPLSSGGEIPTSWTGGQICSQRSTTVGSVGPVLKQQVIASTCEDADASCSAECPNELGKLIELLDPLALLGG